MITSILIAVGIIAIVVAYVVGRVQGIPDLPFPPFYPDYYLFDYWRRSQDCSLDYISRTTAKINEEHAYQKGVLDGKIQTERYYQYNPKTISQGELIEKLKGAIKPLEELKKEYNIK